MNRGSTNLGMLSEIPRIARENELRRHELHDRATRVAIRALGRMPTLLSDFLKMLSAAVVGFWILTVLFAYVSQVEPLYALAALGLLFSAQATFYKFKLATDPDFKISSCGCGGSRADNTAAVLRSKESSILGVPNSVLAIVLYAALLVAVSGDHRDVAIALAVSAALASAYFGYVMVFRVASLCATCINIAALNALILVQLVR